MSNDSIAIQNLRNDINNLRQQIWTPNLEHLEDLPVFHGPNDMVAEYYAKWRDCINRAQDLYMPFMNDEKPKAESLPHHLNLPIFFFNVDRVRINKTSAKESKTFRGVASLLEKCGSFDLDQVPLFQNWLNSDDTAALVAHREFIDLRIYVFQHGSNEYTRTRFYVNGVVLGTEEHFELIDARNKPRKKRNDSLSNLLADNGTWKVFGVYR